MARLKYYHGFTSGLSKNIKKVRSSNDGNDDVVKKSVLFYDKKAFLQKPI